MPPNPLRHPVQSAIAMKPLFLLLALLLAAPAALHAQPTNREYNRLQEATNRAYSVPDRPAPSSTRAERSYTPSSSSSPNTPSSSGYSGSADYYSPQNVGKRIAEIERQGQMERDKQAAAARERQQQETADYVAKYVRSADEMAQFEAHVTEQRRAERRELAPFVASVLSMGYDNADALQLAAQLNMIIKVSRYSPSTEVRPQLDDAKQARLMLQSQLAQPGGDYVKLRELVGREWGIVKEPKVFGSDEAFGVFTAIRDYTELETRFPAQKDSLDAALVKMSLVLMGYKYSTNDYLDETFNLFGIGVVELSKHFYENKKVACQVLAASPNGAESSLMEADVTEANRKEIRLALPMLYEAYQAKLLTHPTDCGLAEKVVKSAERLLALRPDAPLATRVEWLMQSLGKKNDVSSLLVRLLDDPSYFSALTDGQAQEVSTTLGITLGDQSARARLARMLPPTKVLPDNPDWQALKAGEPLAETIRQLATKYKGNVGELLLGTLIACTKPGQDGQNEAMAYWDKAKDDGWNKDNGTRTIVAMRTAARNMYRAVTLDQGGDYKTVYRVKGKDDADDLLFYKKLSYSPTARELVSKSWGEQQLLFKAAEEVKSYQDALVLLDQSSDFPPIGATMKKKAKVKLQYLAKNGYALAQAKLKEL